MAYGTGRLTRNLVRSLGPGRHGDGSGLYLGSGPIDFGLVAYFTVRKRAVNMSDLFWLSDAQMARLERFFPSPRASPVSMIGGI